MEPLDELSLDELSLSLSVSAILTLPPDAAILLLLVLRTLTQLPRRRILFRSWVKFPFPF